MKRVGIIGLGTITKNYLKGLLESEFLSLTAVCDRLENSVSKDFFKEYPFYFDYKHMIQEENLDYVIISTPPASHYEISMYAMMHGVNVILEKPAVLDLVQYQQLVETAHENNVIFEVMYHWQNGSEVLAFNGQYDVKRISKIHVTVLDPYSDDGLTINEDKVKLCGAWVDSGVNILSMIKMWLPFDSYKLVDCKVQRCQKTDLPICVEVHLELDGVLLAICVDWTKHRNDKSSYVIYDGRKVEIRHSQQAIVDEDTVKLYDDMERLQHHYYNYFKNYREIIDKDASYKIHWLLLELDHMLV